ncbi:bro-2 [Hyposidra talaca nucleopolyhedrovirus]|uniref:Bro-2 n=1 Tax=Hyposidra talaca nucleopolyhedrovirus TaxID=1070315 RepID=A0A2Z4HI01_9ABAC|nr:bro-2 [Hyposidra talaca nucleopolyhedrovirus]AWW14401.1 bro-2 [Hyposidra talaca nucleopolyhedrovirus]
MNHDIEHEPIKSIAKKDHQHYSISSHRDHYHHDRVLIDSAFLNTDNKCIIQDATLVKPKNARLQHAFVVCEMSDNRFAFLRTQLRSINRSLKNLRNNESDVPPSIVLKINYVPNSINLFNKLKELLPSGKFKAKNNTIQLTQDFNRTMLLNTIKFLVKQ